MGYQRFRRTLFGVWLLVSFTLLAPLAGRAADFQPDEAINSLVVRVKTSDIDLAGTDDDVFFSISSTHEWQLDAGFFVNDFERGSERDYSLNASGLRVQDIQRIRIRKSPDGLFGGWNLGFVNVFVNGKLLYDSGVLGVWLEDEGTRVWEASDFTPVVFAPLGISNVALADGTSNTLYTAEVTGEGGKAPYTWSIAVVTNAALWAAGPTIAALSNTRGRIGGRSAGEGSSAVRITIRDARNVTATRTYTIRFITTLPPPVITGISPNAGWRPLPAGFGILPAVVEISGSNFDTRPGNTAVRFNGGVAAASLQVVSRNLLRATVPAGAAVGTGPITVTTPFGTATTPPTAFRIHPYGFRPVHGYNFANFGGPRELSWDTFRDLFGSGQVEYTTPFGVFAKPFASLFYLFAFKDVAAGGNCHGFTLSSLRFARGDTDLDRYDPRTADRVFGLTGSTFTRTDPAGFTETRLNPPFTERLLNVHQGAQLGLDALLFFAFNNRSDNPVQLLNEVTASLANPLANPMQISITDDSGNGHMLTPYAVETVPGTNQSLIRVYDPNKPFSLGETNDGNSAITIDRVQNTWSYPFSSSDTWSGPYLFAIPYSRYPARPTLATDPLDLALLLLVVFADAKVAQVSDEAGRSLYDSKGNLNRDPRTRLPGAYRVTPLDAGEPGEYPDVTFVAGDPKAQTLPALTAEVVGSDKPNGKYIATLLTPQGAYSLGNLDSAPGLRDRLALNPKTGALELTAASEKKGAWLEVLQRVSDGKETIERSFAFANVAIGAGDRVQLTSDPEAGGVGLHSVGKGEVRYDLLLETVSSQGKTRQLLGRFTNRPGATQRFTLPLLGKASIQTDLDSDGKMDQVEELKAQELPPAGKLGDVNGDGSVTPVDAAWVLRFVLGHAKPDEGQIQRADVSPRKDGTVAPDGKLTVEDAVEVLRVVIGLTPPLGGTLDAFERPAIYPRLPEPLPKPVEFPDRGPILTIPTIDLGKPIVLDPTLPVLPPLDLGTRVPPVIREPILQPPLLPPGGILTL